MPREELVTAAEALKEATTAVSNHETLERMDETVTQLEGLAEVDSGPDQERLARVIHGLSELKDDVDDPGAMERIESARDHVKAYRETVDGV